MEENSSSEPFKKPFLPVKVLPSDPLKKSRIQASSTDESNIDLSSDKLEKVSEPIENDSKLKVQCKKKAEKSQITVPLPYKEPDWCGNPPSNYNIEIIKNGLFISTLPIKSSLIVFGRLDVCDVIFEHPSVSRYHAVIQFCKGDHEHPRGFYLYDLGSTHGTFLNKEKIKSNIYYKLKVGYILKFGGSSRLHIFQGPEEDEELNQANEVLAVKEPEQDLCDWGMGEEAIEEEDLTENPFAVSTDNEELYLDDPKKTLRGWFEREGYELEYSVEEKGFRTFSCTVRLPIDNPTGDYLPVEASVSGKKKEAVIACALEACRTLDKLGLLRQSHQESRQRKRKKWEENDYYDSDEDTFYDRTGEIEKRREMRKRLAKKVEVDNFQTIETKLKVLNEEIEEIRNKVLEKGNVDSNKSSTNQNDPLDAYMSELSESSSILSDKIERRKLKLKLIELEKEKKRLEKLSDIARPTKLPPIAKHPGIIGKKIKSKLNLVPAKISKVTKTSENDEEIEENDSDDQNDNSGKPSNDFVVENEDKSQSGKYGLIKKIIPECESSEILSKKEISIVTNSKIDSEVELQHDEKDSKDMEVDIDESDSKKIESISTVPEEVPVSKSVSATEKCRGSIKKVKKKEVFPKHVDVYKTDTTEYCTWVPPSNQSGDGYTHLNEKYGY